MIALPTILLVLLIIHGSRAHGGGYGDTPSCTHCPRQLEKGYVGRCEHGQDEGLQVGGGKMHR